MSLALKICTKFLLQERLQVSFEEQQKQNPISHEARLKKRNQGDVQEKFLPNGDYKLLKLDSIQTKTSFSNNKNCINKEAYNNNQTPSQLPNSD